MPDAVLERAASLGVMPFGNTANIARGGQLGTGIRLTRLDAAATLVFNPATVNVLSMPSMFDPYDKLKIIWAANIETNAKSITGIDIRYTMETAETVIGMDGQSMKVPTRVTRAAVDPSMTFQEVTGNLIWNITRKWLFMIQHPDTNASSLPANISNSAEIPEWVPSAYSMSIMVIQYDPTGLPDRIIDAAIITNMFPTDTGDLGMERTIGTTKTMERSIPFTGVIQHNENTRELGRRMAQMLELHKINMDFALPGVAGTVDPTAAIDKDIQGNGGLNYEVHGPNGNDGILDRYSFQGPGGNSAYEDALGKSSPIAKTPIV